MRAVPEWGASASTGGGDISTSISSLTPGVLRPRILASRSSTGSFLPCISASPGANTDTRGTTTSIWLNAGDGVIRTSGNAVSNNSRIDSSNPGAASKPAPPTAISSEDTKVRGNDLKVLPMLSSTPLARTPSGREMAFIKMKNARMMR